MNNRRIAWIIAGFAALSTISLGAQSAAAQFADLYPGFFELERPGYAQLTLFGGGFASDRYGVTQEGFQFEQSVTQYVGVFGRAIAYQLYTKDGELNPFDPSEGHSPRINFGRFQGGVDLAVAPGASLFLSGGGDAGNAHGGLIEGDFISWLFRRGPHPMNFSFSAIHTFQNGVTSGEIDLQWLLATTENWMLLAGAGGAIYGGGFISQAEGQGGPDLSVYYRPWGVGLGVQAGYGVAHNYGQLTLFKRIGWNE